MNTERPSTRTSDDVDNYLFCTFLPSFIHSFIHCRDAMQTTQRISSQRLMMLVCSLPCGQWYGCFVSLNLLLLFSFCFIFRFSASSLVAWCRNTAAHHQPVVLTHSTTLSCSMNSHGTLPSHLRTVCVAFGAVVLIDATKCEHRLVDVAGLV